MHLPLVLMSVKASEEMGNEVREKVDQLYRIEQGNAEIVLCNKEEHETHDGDAIVVTAGTWHDVINASKTAPLKLYTVYTPPQHPDATVHKTRA